MGQRSAFAIVRISIGSPGPASLIGVGQMTPREPGQVVAPMLCAGCRRGGGRRMGLPPPFRALRLRRPIEKTALPAGSILTQPTRPSVALQPHEMQAPLFHLDHFTSSAGHPITDR
jgi:hypothetical protein